MELQIKRPGGAVPCRGRVFGSMSGALVIEAPIRFAHKALDLFDKIWLAEKKKKLMKEHDRAESSQGIEKRNEKESSLFQYQLICNRSTEKY